MKRILAKQKHYQSLIHAFRSHPEFAEGKSLIEHYVAELETREQRMSEILSDLFRPVSFLYSVKKNAEEQLNDEMTAFTSLGCMAGSIRNNNTLYEVMKTYKSQLYKVSAFRLYLNAIHVAEMLQHVETSVAGPDFHTKKLPAFRKQAEAFGRQLNDLKEQLLRRKVLRKELAALIASTNIMLHDVFDSLANGLQDTYPEFYREYMLIRHPHKRKKRTVKKLQTGTLATINTQPVSDAAPKLKPETEIRKIETILQETVPAPETENQVADVITTEPNNEVPAEYLAQISELIFNRNPD